ncbi:MAG TPA: hypothetical protein VHC67_03325 [Gaiellaceae bacterium]|nr:hypothetical protein [Gaiellaceae bacterium]
MYVIIGFVVLGTILTPGFGAVALVAAPFLGLGFLWRTALAVSTRGRSTDAVAVTTPSRLLGPGGPDDTFAASPLDEPELSGPTAASRVLPRG